MALGYNEPFPRSVGSFQRPVVPPDSDPDDGAIMTVCFSAAWLPFILGALQQLTLQATWQGDAATVLQAQERAMLLMAMIGSGSASCESCMTVCGIVYDSDTDQIKQTYDGGATYVPNPGQDPRHADQFRYPAVGGLDPQCKAAGNMVNFIQSLISSIEEGLQVAGALTGLTAFALPFFLELGPFAVFFELVDALCSIAFTAGHAALAAAFTDATYDTLTCIFFCDIGSDGQVSSGQLDQIKFDVSDQLSGLANDVLQACFLLMGEVGLSNAGTQGESTRDCSGCSCTHCYEWDFTSGEQGWTPAPSGRAVYTAGVGWTANADGYTQIASGSLPTTVHMVRIAMLWEESCLPDSGRWGVRAPTFDDTSEYTTATSNPFPITIDGQTWYYFPASADVTSLWISGDNSGECQQLHKVRIYYTGDEVSGWPECT